MKLIILITVAITNVFGYHDPDLDYHLSQVQKVIPNCNHGYDYPVPAVQLSNKVTQEYLPPVQVSTKVTPEYLPPVAASGYAATGYSAPQITYAQPAATYQSSLTSNYATASKEVHGYATSAGLSSATSPRPITPVSTYAQAPIIAKVTGSPLIAKYSLAPAKTSFTTQNLVAQAAYQTGSLAKASLNYNVQAGGPVVSQVYANTAAKYTVAPELKAQTQVASYNFVTPGVQYSQVGKVGQYATSSVSAASGAYFSPAQQVTHYAAPVPQYTQAVQYAPAAAPVPQYNQYSAPAVAQYSAPAAVTQYTTHTNNAQYAAPAAVTYHGARSNYAAPSVQYAAPAVQYAAPAVQYAAPAVQYAAPVQQYAAPVQQYAAPVHQYAAPVQQYSATPAVASVSQYSAPAVTHHVSPVVNAVAAPVAKIATTGLSVKNAHTEFLENYDSHPRYAFEYQVNDPHTGDIKQQKEERDGEVVKGQYSLVEPDGSVRTVNYVADWETGFHADVHNSKDDQH